MHLTLLRIGGVLNSLFLALHIFLGYQIHFIQNIDPGLRAVMEMLNIAVSLLVAFSAVASFAYARELMTTRLGKPVIILIIALYGTRALEEILLSPQFSKFIFGACILTTAIYLIPLFLAAPKDKTTANPNQAEAEPATTESAGK